MLVTRMAIAEVDGERFAVHRCSMGRFEVSFFDSNGDQRALEMANFFVRTRHLFYDERQRTGKKTERRVYTHDGGELRFAGMNEALLWCIEKVRAKRAARLLVGAP